MEIENNSSMVIYYAMPIPQCCQCFFPITSKLFSKMTPKIFLSGGSAVMTNLVQGLSVELATGMIAAVVGMYTFYTVPSYRLYVSSFLKISV